MKEMNKKWIIGIIIAIILIIGGVASYILLNKEEEKSDINNEVTLYIFHGNTCPACKNAISNITEKKNSLYSGVKVVTYELWKTENREVNGKLMTKVAEALGVDAEYIPFMVIGNYSTTGYNEKTLLKEIKKASQDPNYQDVVKKVLEENENLKPNSETIENN